MHDKGPSGGHETDFILIQDDDTDLGPQSSKLKEVIQEQQNEIHHLSLNLEKAKWIIIGVVKQTIGGSTYSHGVAKHL